MELDDEDQPGPGRKQGLRFGVATIKALGSGLRAYFNVAGRAEWLWNRVQQILGIKTYGGKFLADHRHRLQTEMEFCQIPESQLHYKPRGYVPSEEEPWSDHTLESRALLALLAMTVKCKQIKPEPKAQALQLFTCLVSIALPKALELDEMPDFPRATSVNKLGEPRSTVLKVSKQNLCQDWKTLMEHIPEAQTVWETLLGKDWLTSRLSSPWQFAKLDDIAMFLLYLGANPALKVKHVTLWEAIGLETWPNLIGFPGECLEVYARDLSKQGLEELPPLTTSKGFARKGSDKVNQLLVLDRVKAERLHRWRMARTHSNLIGQHCRLMKQEAYLASVLHDQQSAIAFTGVKQVSCCWDPSTYGGQETFVGMVYSAGLDLATYLLVQPLRRLLIAELDDELKEPGRKGKLTRVEGYVEVRALSNALKNLGLALPEFAVPQGLHLQPLKAGEMRVQVEGRWFIVNQAAQTAMPQVPEGLNMADLPLLVSVSDQGPNNMAALNYLQFSDNAILCTCLFDCFHRAWNDIKLACKKASSYPWRTILELTLVYNLPYGPFGSGTWFGRKQDCLQDFLSQHSARSPLFQEHLPLICRELGINEPQNLPEQQDLFDRLGSLNSFLTKGPLVKLMRWFSFFESATFYSGELWATKMVLASSSAQKSDEEEEGPGVTEAQVSQNREDPRKELAQLKKTKGTWKLAPQLITARNIDLQRMLLTVCRSTWKHHAGRARDLKSPEQILTYNIACANDKA